MITKRAYFRNFIVGWQAPAAAIARARQDQNNAASLAPLIPIALLTMFMLAVVIKPV
jgi:hypothetical protein